VAAVLSLTDYESKKHERWLKEMKCFSSLMAAEIDAAKTTDAFLIDTTTLRTHYIDQFENKRDCMMT